MWPSPPPMGADRAPRHTVGKVWAYATEIYRRVARRRRAPRVRAWGHSDRYTWCRRRTPGPRRALRGRAAAHSTPLARSQHTLRDWIVRRRRATRVPSQGHFPSRPKIELLACCSLAKSRVLLLPDKRDCTMSAAACCLRLRISDAGAHCPAHPLLTTRLIPTLLSRRCCPSLPRRRPSTSSSRHIKLNSNSIQTQFKLKSKPSSNSTALRGRVPPAETRKSPPAAAGGGSLLRAQPLQQSNS